jgi:hypothetical protein
MWLVTTLLYDMILYNYSGQKHGLSLDPFFLILNLNLSLSLSLSLSFYLCVCVCVCVLGVELRASCKLGKWSVPEIHPPAPVTIS